MRRLSLLRRAALACALALGAALPATAEDAAPDILSIGGPITEIVAALGQGHRLKARDTTSTYPPQVTALPDVGYMRALSPEGVLSVAPDFILTTEGAGPPQTVDLLRAAGLRMVSFPDPLTPDAIAARIVAVGEALGVPGRGRALAAEVTRDLAAARTAADRPTPLRRRVLFVLSAEGGKIMAAGRETGADALIQMAGGVNAVTGVSGYTHITDEAIGAAAPDVILMMDRGGDHGLSDADLLALPSLRLTPAGQSGAVVRMDGLLMLGFGPRVATAVRRLSSALYGASE